MPRVGAAQVREDLPDDGGVVQRRDQPQPAPQCGHARTSTANAKLTTSELYEALEPRLNARQVVLLDVPEVEQQLLGLVWCGSKIDHPAGEHDDWATVVAGVVELILGHGATSFDPFTWSVTKNFVQPMSGPVVDAQGTRYAGNGTFITRSGERYRDPRYS